MSQIREESGVTDIGGIEVRETVGGPATEIGEVWVREAGGLTLVWALATALVISASPLTVFGYAATDATLIVESRSTTVSVEGGKAPYTYSWAKTSDTGGTWSISSPTSATTKFGCLVNPYESFTATFVCTVTDARGETAMTATITASVGNYGPLGGTI